MATGDITADNQTRVQVRASKTNAWRTVSYLTPIRVQRAVGPSISTCTLRYEFGDIKREDASAFTAESQLDGLNGEFVRVQYEATPEAGDWVTAFYGIIMGEQFQLMEPDGAVAVGDQHLMAYGLEVLLDRNPLWFSVVTNVSGVTVGVAYDTFVFNASYGRSRRFGGNRSDQRFSQNANGVPWGRTYVFSDRQPFNSHPAKAWRLSDIIVYSYSLRPATGVLLWSLGGQKNLLDEIIPQRFDPTGMTTADILNRFVDRRRGLGWCVRVIEDANDPGLDFPEIYVYSTFGDDVTAFQGTSKVTVQKNSSQVAVTLDGRHDITVNPSVKLDLLAEYDWVVVRGARIKTQFTAPALDGTFVAGWTNAEQIAYESMTDNERRAAGNVYETFYLRSTFSWLFNEDGNGPIRWALPTLDFNGVVSDVVSQNLYNDMGSTMERQLLSRWPDGQFYVPRAFIKVGSEWSMTDDPSSDSALPGMSLIPLDHRLGFTLRSNSLPHAIGLNHFTGTNSAETPVADWLNMLATICLTTNQRVVVAANLSGASNVGTAPEGRVLVIDVPDAEFWWNVPNTILGLSTAGTGPFFREFRTVLRDDTERLRRIAALAKAWYSSRRTGISWTKQGLDASTIEVGQFAKVTHESFPSSTRGNLGGVVSSVLLDFQEFETIIKTDYERPSFASIF